MTKTISIDESKCNGCGLCVTACHEGALALVDGKAKLVRPNFCDGMGDCLPACPQDAISFTETRTDDIPVQGIPMHQPNMMSIPGVQWPIQLALVSSASGFLKGELVIAADCTAFTVDDFKKRFINGRPLVIGCPKLDDRSRFDKLVEMFGNGMIESVDILRMEVPCCSQLTNIVLNAVKTSGKNIPVKETVVRRDGSIIS